VIVAGCWWGCDDAGDGGGGQPDAVADGSGSQEPVAGVVPYDVAMQLFADEAVKFRFIRLPEGGHIDYDPDAHWVLPVGTILVKTFAYYTDYRIDRAGETHRLDYRVPNTNQCQRCHGDVVQPLGPHTRQMNRDNTYGGQVVNQIEHL
jgi:hypothetical protein